MESKEIELAQCFGCKKHFITKLLTAIYVKTEYEDSYIRAKRFLCPKCLEKLKQTNWVRTQEFKKEKEDKNGKRTKG